MNLRNKLLVGFGIVLLVTLIAFTLMYVALQNIGASYKGLVNTEVYKLNLAHEIQYEDLVLFDSIKGIILEPSNMKEKEKYNQYVEKITKNIEEVKPLLKDNRAKEVFEELDQYKQEMVELETEILNSARNDHGKTMRLFYGDYADVRAIFSGNLEEFKQVQLNALSSQVKKDNEFIKSQSIISIILVVIALLIGVITALFMSSMITKPLKVVVEKLDELSKNEGDLTVRLEVKSKDEIGMLSKSFNQMIENIQNLIRQVQVTTVEVASSAEQLSASADQSAQATNQITFAIQEIASGAETQVRSAEQSTNAMDEMVLGIQKTADSAAHVTEAALQTTKDADQGNRAIVKSIQQMTTIQEVVGDAGVKVEELGTLSNEIGQILDVISGIADQTNLLALNAAIEAARAGESGRGFAVVADEVRKLAEQSKDSATQITNLIHQIQLNTSHAVQSMKKGTGEVEEGMKVVNEAGNAFNKILLSVQDVSDQILEVSSSSQQMSAGSQQVAAAVQEQSSIAKEASATSHNVATASEEQAATIEEISYSIDNLSKMAEQLQLLVGKFTV